MLKHLANQKHDPIGTELAITRSCFQLSRGLTVKRTVGEHIRDLEERLNLLSGQVMDESNAHKRNDLEAELRAVESALALYRAAFEVENRVATHVREKHSRKDPNSQNVVGTEKSRESA